MLSKTFLLTIVEICRLGEPHFFPTVQTPEWLAEARGHPIDCRAPGTPAPRPARRGLAARAAPCARAPSSSARRDRPLREGGGESGPAVRGRGDGEARGAGGEARRGRMSLVPACSSACASSSPPPPPPPPAAPPASAALRRGPRSQRTIQRMRPALRAWARPIAPLDSVHFRLWMPSAYAGIAMALQPLPPPSAQKRRTPTSNLNACPSERWASQCGDVPRSCNRAA